MKMRAGLLVSCAASALIIGAGFASQVVAADMPVKAPPLAAPTWWYEGYVEIGGRFFLERTPESTLGKYYEYKDPAPGVFGNFRIAAHRTNPIDIEAWGKNVGYDDQAYGLYLAKVGTIYLNVGWDETPHVFAKNARTTYNGIGTNILSTPTYPFPPSAASLAFVNANSRTIDVEYKRDTASAQLRWTPSAAWDFNVDYSHTHRHGTQPLNAITFTNPVGGRGPTRAPIEMPKPVDDVTQNGNVKGEYAGATPWGTMFNVALSYGFSKYDNDVGCSNIAGYIPAPSNASCLTFQNPWVAVNTGVNPLWNRYSLAPSNNAQTLSASGAVGLPGNSRYMATFQWSRMEQDDPFMPSVINPLVPVATTTGSNLGGDANTTLFNNVLHTRWTQNIKSTLRYRYFDYSSNWGPITITGLYANPDTITGLEPPEIARPRNFTKQNASGDLTWRATRWLTVGGRYAWERWNREWADVAVTNEHIGKVFADAKWDWSTLRTTLQYSQRRYDGVYGPSVTANNNNFFRVRDLANRDRTIGKVSWAIEAMPFTFTPLGGFRVDDYGTNPFANPAEIGLVYAHAWNAGAEVAFNWSRMAHFYFSYTYENMYRKVFQNGGTPDLILASNDQINTFVLGSKITLVPDKLILKTSYTLAMSTSDWDWGCTVNGCRYNPLATAPDSHNTWQRLEVKAKYYLDDSFIRQAGWMGKAFVKARLVWERNSSDAWQPLSDQLGWAVNPANSTMARAVFLATGSPNYNAVLAALSFGVKW